MSRYFGLGIGITQQQLDEINYKRTDETSDWREYIGKTAAMDVYGSIKKKLTSKHALIQYFDLGVQNEGYWDYNHMALQMEDVYDVVSTVYPHFDFVAQMDQSAGHGKKRERGLDVSMMRKKWGGKQSKKITLSSCQRPSRHRARGSVCT